VRLLWLLELAGKEPIGKKWHTAPGGARRRYQELENAVFAIEYITQKKGVKLVGIAPEHIVDGHEKLTLGLIWSGRLSISL
jgi:hypothetical protein